MARIDLARRAIEITKLMQPLKDELKRIKTKLRKAADGNKLEIEVSGFGSVLVCQKSAATEKTIYVVDESALVASGLRQELLDKGVVLCETKITGGGDAMIRIQVNK